MEMTAAPARPVWGGSASRRCTYLKVPVAWAQACPLSSFTVPSVKAMLLVRCISVPLAIRLVPGVFALQGRDIGMGVQVAEIAPAAEGDKIVKKALCGKVAAVHFGGQFGIKPREVVAGAALVDE